MDLLFAPWRMAYVTNAEKKCGCFLCAAVDAEPCDDNLVVLKGSGAIVILNRYPYVSGHVMVAPCRHVASPLDLTPDEGLEMMGLVRRSMMAIQKVYGPQGFNIGMNVGQAAGAGLKDHIHMHVVPRWNGDTNFVPVIGDVKIIPEALEVTRVRLSRAFQEQEV